MTMGHGTDQEQDHVGEKLRINQASNTPPIQSKLGLLFPKLEEELMEVLDPIGFEAFPFKVGWYNELVGPRFHLNYDDSTLAVVIISGPDTFEKCVIPYVKTQLVRDEEFYCRDPLDDSMKCIFRLLTHKLTSAGYDAETFHDFDLYPSRKPKVLVQTAAHVAGCVEYYHRDRLSSKEPSWCKAWKLFGVAIHPLYGGWFAIRGVVILKNLTTMPDNDLPKPERPISGVNEEVISHLLEEFGSNWKTNSWRDIIPKKCNAKYSQHFINYLATDSDQRWDLVKSIVS